MFINSSTASYLLAEMMRFRKYARNYIEKYKICRNSEKILHCENFYNAHDSFFYLFDKSTFHDNFVGKTCEKFSCLFIVSNIII